VELQERSNEALYQIMLARYYSSSLARFLAVDPSGESIVLEDPQSWNRYAYTGNNPLKYIDPDGQLKFDSMDAASEYAKARNYLVQSEAGAATINNLESLSGANEPTLVLNNQDDDSFDPNTNTINWDADSGLDVAGEGGKPDSSGGTIQSPALGLAHEADHAVQGNTDPQKQNKDAGKKDAKYDNKEEKRVVKGSEKKTAKQLDEPTRKSHGGKPVTTGGATDKKKATK
jgi:RHS repeat-associated protein